uniref:Uncharacterized protein n=1 Tax=Arundo donax TaxID=35708 RepID=A0A0A9I3S8_ARUDO
MTSQTKVRLRLISRTLRCVQLGMCALADITVVDTPRLERLFLWMIVCRNKCSRIKIGHAPNLRMLGYLQPGNHELEISNTVIKAGTKMNPSTTIPSVQILALDVQFEVRNDVKMVPCFLKCFPNVETLHIYSKNAQNPTGKINLKFWQEAGNIECVQRHVKKVIFQEFRGTKNELVFLKFIAERAQVLEKMVIMVASECFSSADDPSAKLKPLSSAKWVSQDSKLIVFNSPVAQSGAPSWHFHLASDFSLSDPFGLLTADAELSKGASVVDHPSTP